MFIIKYCKAFQNVAKAFQNVAKTFQNVANIRNVANITFENVANNFVNSKQHSKKYQFYRFFPRYIIDRILEGNTVPKGKFVVLCVILCWYAPLKRKCLCHGYGCLVPSRLGSIVGPEMSTK